MAAALKVAGAVTVGMIVLYSQKSSLKANDDIHLKSAFYSLWGMAMILWILFLLEIPIPSLSRLMTALAEQYFD
ncbi:hypothetical protein EPH95_12020 [Salicibibacter halophilus]|uniref:Uncharacterized protein n=1 Tax=Salicibibacter halophilus TaxID=2502791 RepID=A0A514LKM7_9BACI|nr:hypothetical protein [Salicibibacter halophilus]QDI91811.1 hypothetical protein EPH95_12020 [Salicibibacter halophilus]